VRAARAAFNAFFRVIEPWAEARANRGSFRLGRPGGPGEAAGPEPAADPEIGEALDRTLIALGDLDRELDALMGHLDGHEELRDALQGRVLDLGGSRTRLGNIDRALRLCLLPGTDSGSMVRWLEVRRSGIRNVRNICFAAAPVELGPLLAEHVFDRAETAVLTSATMAAAGDFGYIKQRLGLAGHATPALADAQPAGIEVAETVLASPFDHAAQSLLAIPTDLPGRAGRGGAAAHPEATSNVVRDVATITGGGLFVLFTSYAALNAVAGHLRAGGAEGRWPLLVQGERDRTAMLRKFARSGEAILLGTASFWEGVDVPGWPLRALVIHKLPFRVPTEPMTEARIEAMEERGENSFWNLMVPDAAMRLKQGVGRLIRTRTDRGAALILDDRLLTRRYGRLLLEALPPMPLVKGPWDEVRERVADFYAPR